MFQKLPDYYSLLPHDVTVAAAAADNMLFCFQQICPVGVEAEMKCWSVIWSGKMFADC